MSKLNLPRMQLSIGVGVIADFLHGHLSDADQLDLYHKHINRVELSDNATADELRIPKMNVVEMRAYALTDQGELIRYQENLRLGQSNSVALRRHVRGMMSVSGVIRLAVICDVWVNPYHKQTQVHLLEVKQPIKNKE